MHQNSVTLDSAGAITRYFAKAKLNGIPSIAWPEKK